MKFLNEISCFKERPLPLEIIVEPTFVALGPYHMAVGMNNRAWFYMFGEKGIQDQNRSVVTRDVFSRIFYLRFFSHWKSGLPLNTADP